MKRSILELHRILVSTLIPILFSFPLLMALWGYAYADAIPDIKLNGMDNIDALSSRSTLSATIALDAGDAAGEAADWWIAAETPMGLESIVDYTRSPDITWSGM